MVVFARWCREHAPKHYRFSSWTTVPSSLTSLWSYLGRSHDQLCDQGVYSHMTKVVDYVTLWLYLLIISGVVRF